MGFGCFQFRISSPKLQPQAFHISRTFCAINKLVAKDHSLFSAQLSSIFFCLWNQLMHFFEITSPFMSHHSSGTPHLIGSLFQRVLQGSCWSATLKLSFSCKYMCRRLQKSSQIHALSWHSLIGHLKQWGDIEDQKCKLSVKVGSLHSFNSLCLGRIISSNFNYLCFLSWVSSSSTCFADHLRKLHNSHYRQQYNNHLTMFEKDHILNWPLKPHGTSNIFARSKTCSRIILIPQLSNSSSTLHLQNCKELFGDQHSLTLSSTPFATQIGGRFEILPILNLHNSQT